MAAVLEQLLLVVTDLAGRHLVRVRLVWRLVGRLAGPLTQLVWCFVVRRSLLTSSGGYDSSGGYSLGWWNIYLGSTGSLDWWYERPFRHVSSTWFLGGGLLVGGWSGCSLVDSYWWAQQS